MKTLFISLLILLALTAVTCRRGPTAGFSTDKTEYYQGEKITITNSSNDLDQFTWTLPDGSKSNEREPAFVIPDTMPSGNYQIRLDGKNSSGKTGQSSKVITVKQLAVLTVWTMLTMSDSVPVYINNTLKGYTKKSAGKPLDCGQKGLLNIRLKPGKYTMTARSPAVTWKANLDVPESGCVRFELD